MTFYYKHGATELLSRRRIVQPPARNSISRFILFAGLNFLVVLSALGASTNKHASDLYILTPLTRPEIPAVSVTSTNPIDAFIIAQYQAKGLKPVGPADKRTLLRRVYLDLVGLPPTIAEQEAFLQDTTPDAYEKVVDHLLASDQHAVRYARHWLDVLRYADTDERMAAAPGIYLWRDWVIQALNEDLPYDDFVRAQLTGYRSRQRTQMSATGFRQHVEPHPDDMFARGFLSRSEASELSINAVETVSTAFMGLTVGCAKCHDHMYDPIKQRDFYALKAVFDPLVIKKVTLATSAEILANAKARDAAEKKFAPIERALTECAAPYKKKVYDERLAMLPAEVQAVIVKPEAERSAEEQKIADNYFPILRIDTEKFTEVMPEAERKKYHELEKQLNDAKNAAHLSSLPAFWTVETDHGREMQKSYILTSGNIDRPELNHEVQPGWPFASTNIDFHEGRVEAFSDWLTAPENPMFARVAVNRLWQWHFGEGIQKIASDFGELGGAPANPQLLDWLASEFVARKFSMKEMHKLIVMSDTYKMSSEAGPQLAANSKIDPGDSYLWHFRLQRLEAEPIWDSIFTAAGNLDLAVGGPSFDLKTGKPKSAKDEGEGDEGNVPNRRAAYMTRGFSTSRDVMPNFLQAFDVDDGRTPCPMRTQTVTAPQSLFLMNSREIDLESEKVAERLKKDAGGDIGKAVDAAYEAIIARPPSSAEKTCALAYLDNDPARLKNFAWLLFNLDEFVYVR